MKPRPAAAAPPAPPSATEEAALRQRLAERPDSAADWQRLGLLLAAARRPAEAAQALERAVAAGASAAALAIPRALALSDAGRAEDAVQVATEAQRRRPKDFGLANLLGVLLKRAGRLEDAIPLLEAARRLDPRSVSPCQNLGNVLDLLGRHREAAAAYAGGVRIAPRDAELHRLHARALRAMGAHQDAAASLERAFAIDPRARAIVSDLVGVLVDLGQPDRATETIARARRASPEGAALHDMLAARVALRGGDLPAALSGLEAAIAADPTDAHAHLLLARAHGDGDRRAANAALRRGLALNPGSSILTGELIESLSRSRYDDEAAHLEEAYALACGALDGPPAGWRDHVKALRTSFQRCLDHDRLDATGTLAELAPRWLAEGSVSPLHYELGNVRTLEERLAIVEWHRDWGRRQSARIQPATPMAMPALSTGRPIRIGFMSSDLRDHPVSYFALPLLEGHDPDRFAVHCYSFYERDRDKVQAHIEGKVAAFRWWPRRPTAEIAAGIAADGLDILFELGGSTAMNRIEVMAHRPARIGASWLGYPHSAGFEQIDCILTDPYIRPEDPRLLIERPFELPETWVTLGRLGFRDEPIDVDLPERRQGHLTFGTMNNPYKYTRACIDAWAAVLRAVPGSHFLFVRPEARTPAFVANARAAFAARDVDPDRLDFIGIRGDHLKHYNSIDIALDSLPHTGGTTTCETLWMGVPVVSMVGPGFAERLSYSNLSNAGLGDLAVRTVEDFVATAAALAEDRSRRWTLRHGLRAMMRERPLGQVDRFVRDFYDKVDHVVRQ
ncbi:tetratricopeptide repeat protein [Roseomonas sp. CECT 9278]|uniref:O-linked N-acetylglucosamine transferase family protein n=1 Tax=Roseomonas sp. CECT 9278 TaxID=2845823 RepID=UPI001E2EA0B5|nr:tetratricopeptide repeat protein [Roseomonas sp. CECT 9278]CAH0220649.1 Beta-barrel assembly-enhancing protease [Roseomonas sp. CECT 9278]